MPDVNAHSSALNNGENGRSMNHNNGNMIESPIRVYARLRSINKLEASRRSRNCVDVHTDDTVITVDSPVDGEFDYEFDKIFNEHAGQLEVYKSVASSIPLKLLDGQNCALIAYGQTGSGKSYTMVGPKKPPAKALKDEIESKETSLETDTQTEVSKKSSKTSLTATTKGTEKSEVAEESYIGVPDSSDSNAGIIQRTIEDLFDNIESSDSNIEYSIRCSYLDVYMERIIDLLNPGSHNIMVSDTDIKYDVDTFASKSSNPKLYGASEVCCIDKDDVNALLRRGNANRKLQANKLKTRSSRFHSIFIINLTQKNTFTGIEKTSRLSLVDLAGSEVASLGAKKKSRSNRANQQEIKLTKKTFSALNNVIKSLTDKCTSKIQPHDPNRRSRNPYRQSKLTQILKNAFGGDCYTTMILNISPASFSISETMSTLRFGAKCRRVKNKIQKKTIHPISFYESKLMEASKRENDLMRYIEAMACNCQTIQSKFMEGTLTKDSFKDNMWENINNINSVSESKQNDIDPSISIRVINIFEKENNTSIVKSPGSSNPAKSPELHSSNLDSRDDSDVENLRDELKQLINNHESTENQLTSALAQCTELQILNGELTADKKKNMEELIDAKNEIQELSQRKLEVEHNLRTSQFRENEAAVFLRQFRRFYRRLLHNKAKQGSGEIRRIAEKVPGVPDLDDLIDVDTLLLESGLIEESEIREDTSGSGIYRPSSQALIRSSAAAKKAAALERVAEESNTETSLGTNDSSSYTRSTGFPSALNVNPSESLPSVSEMGDGGVSVIIANQRLAEANNQNTPKGEDGNRESSGADDLTSIGKRRIDESPHPLNDKPTDGGADAGAGASATSDSVESSTILSRNSIGFSSANNSLSSTQLADEKQKTLGTPAGRLVGLTQKTIERDLLKMTERCIELQIALNEEKSNVDVLTNKTGSLGKKRMAQEAISLRQALDRKTHDLQAIIWKMNELHLINKTYSEKMENREQHVAYLEESITNLQNQNRVLTVKGRESEKKLREEVEKLKLLVDELTVPLWQFGEEVDFKKSLSNRVIVHVQGGNGKVPIDSSISLVNTISNDEYSTDTSDEEKSAHLEEEKTDNASLAAAAAVGIGVGAAVGVGTAAAICSQSDDEPDPPKFESAPAVSAQTPNTPSVNTQSPNAPPDNIQTNNTQSPGVEDDVIPAAIGAAALGAGATAIISHVETNDASTQYEIGEASESILQPNVEMIDATTQVEKIESIESIVQTDAVKCVDAEIQTDKVEDENISPALAAAGGLAAGAALGAGTAMALSDDKSDDHVLTHKPPTQASTTTPAPSAPTQQQQRNVGAPVSNNTTGTSTQSPEIDDSDATGAIVAGTVSAGAVAAGTAVALDSASKNTKSIEEDTSFSSINNDSKQKQSNDDQNMTSSKATNEMEVVAILDFKHRESIESELENGQKRESERLFKGGRNSSFVPRRHVRKVGPAIKPGVLKEHKKRSSKSKEPKHNRRRR